MTESETQKVEIFQPRSPYDFMEDGEVVEENKFEAVRDLSGGFVDAEDLTFEDFGAYYNLVGTDVVHAEDDEGALREVFGRWNNGSGEECEAFVEANLEERAVSMSTGDVVRVDGTAYLCESFGWGEVEEVSH